MHIKLIKCNHTYDQFFPNAISVFFNHSTTLTAQCASVSWVSRHFYKINDVCFVLCYKKKRMFIFDMSKSPALILLGSYLAFLHPRQTVRDPEHNFICISIRGYKSSKRMYNNMRQACGQNTKEEDNDEPLHSMDSIPI